MAILRGNVDGVLPKRVKISGSFGMQAPRRVAGEQAKAYYELAIASGANIVIEADEGGVPGNGLDFKATADGEAKASLDLSTLTTQIDTVVEAAVGGVAGNALRIVIIAGAAAAAGKVYENIGDGITVFALQHGVSDVDDFETLVGASTDWAVKTGGTGANVFDQATDLVDSESPTGGTPVTWASGTVSSVDGADLHFTTATTAAAAITAINAASSTVTARVIDDTAGAHVFAGGDAVGKQDLANGALTNDIQGDGFFVEKSGTCLYSIVLEDNYASMERVLGTLSLDSAADRDVLFGGYVPRSGSTPAYIIVAITDDDDTGVGTTDSAVHANNRISFEMLMVNTN